MGKTYSTDAAHQKRHFIRTNRKCLDKGSDASEYNIYASVERSFKVDATRYGNQRRAQASAKVEQRRRDRRATKYYEDDE